MHSKELIRGTITPIILKLLYPNHRMYGYLICQQVKVLTNGELLMKEGSLYPALQKLLSSGLIEVEEVMMGKRPRRYYFLTEEGKIQAEEKTEEFSRFLKTMQLFLTKTSQPS